MIMIIIETSSKMSRIICNLCTISSVILATVNTTAKGVVVDCYNTSTLWEYDGHQQTTVTGKPCLRWDQFHMYNNSDFPDAKKSDAANFCRAPTTYSKLWCFTSTSRTFGLCGINKCGDDGLLECGLFNIAKPTLLGRNISFSFTPDTYNPHAILEWQRSMNGVNQWKTLPLNYKFTQHERNMTYYLILTDSVRNNDEVFYRVHYYNETIHCWMDAGKLTLEEPKSVPVILGLQDVESCRGCIVGEDNEILKIPCEIHGGSRPITVTMTIGNESYPHLKFNSTTYIAFCTIKDHHHMKQMMFSVMDDAMSSPVNVTATIFVIKPPTFQFAMQEIIRDGEAFNITCMLDGGRPNPNVYFNISGLEISSAETHFYNSTSSLHTNIITLISFKKEWNKENTTCCRYNEWYKNSRKCLPPKYVKHLSNQDGLEAGDNTCTKGKNKNGAGVEAIVGSVIAASAVGSLIGVICTLFFLTRKGLLKSYGLTKQKPPRPTVFSETEFIEPASTLQSQYDSLDQGAEKCHTYTDLKHSR